MAGGRQGAPGFDPRRLRAAREAAEMTQGALAAAARVHVSAIGEWEAGRRVPQVETVAALARALQIRPQDLLELELNREATLRDLRVAAGLSQQQTASRAGLLRTTYSAIERGDTASLSEADAAAIAEAFDSDVPRVRSAHRTAVNGRSKANSGPRRGRPAAFG